MVQRDFQQVRIIHGSREDAHVHFRLPELFLDGIGQHLFRLQRNHRIPFADELEQARHEDGGNRGDQGNLQGTGQRILFQAGHFGNLVHVVQDHLRLVDDLAPDFRGRHRMGVPVEDADVQLLLQFLHHQAQGRLGEAAGFGRLSEVPILVNGNDIPQLQQCHNAVAIDNINAKIKIIVLINENPGSNFVLRKHGTP